MLLFSIFLIIRSSCTGIGRLYQSICFRSFVTDRQAEVKNLNTAISTLPKKLINRSISMTKPRTDFPGQLAANEFNFPAILAVTESPFVQSQRTALATNFSLIDKDMRFIAIDLLKAILLSTANKALSYLVRLNV